jgi:ribonuclease-3
MSDASQPFNSINKLLPEAFLAGLFAKYTDTSFGDLSIYRKALTHRSYVTRKNENFLEGNQRCPPDCIPLQEEPNERLEFLGDAVLNLAVAAYLFERYPDESEGFLTRMRTKLVNGNMVAQFCRFAGLHEFVIVSKQVEEDTASGGRLNKNVLEDAFEAFLGALFTDRGFDVAMQFIARFAEDNVDFAALVKQHTNHKDAFATYFQQRFREAPVYAEVRHGRSDLEVAVSVRNAAGNVLGVGRGTTRRAAENEAARAALQMYGVLAPEFCVAENKGEAARKRPQL